MKVQYRHVLKNWFEREIYMELAQKYGRPSYYYMLLALLQSELEKKICTILLCTPSQKLPKPSSLLM
jgi:hypothetical protein